MAFQPATHPILTSRRVWMDWMIACSMSWAHVRFAGQRGWQAFQGCGDYFSKASLSSSSKNGTTCLRMSQSMFLLLSSSSLSTKVSMVRSILHGVVLSTSTSSSPSSPSSTGVKASFRTCFHSRLGNWLTYSKMRFSASKRRIIFSVSDASKVFLPSTSTPARFLAVRTSFPNSSARASSNCSRSTACGRFAWSRPPFVPQHLARIGMPAIFETHHVDLHLTRT
mmetsp:Transcript_5917/g.36693  ORF Transcript_5917/g.36693 Transcript_5917/m.36693 type:complete len:224 (+) Transcript_5917:1570-2241(+)